MNAVTPLSPDQLAWRCDPSLLEFQTTGAVKDLEGVIGQARALDAVRFGIGVRQEGYNRYVLGPPGTGKRTVARRFLEQQSAHEPTPSDWCYVQDFDQTHKPQALQFAAGQGAKFQRDMDHLIEDLRTATARIIEQSARVAEDSNKLTAHMRTVADLPCEADYRASASQAAIVQAGHVDQAIDQQIPRADRLKERVQEEIQRGTILIDTEGQRVGQVNGSSVLDLGNYRFGQPSHITATTRLGKGEVVDIELEVELVGAIHSKAVLILSSFLAARFAKDYPLSLSASLVFEQSYGMIEGDSASVGEKCALMSSLGKVPIKQSLAGSAAFDQPRESDA